MTTIALFNNKGGVGKTTLAYHLAFAFERLGKRVMLADLDPQANLTALCLDEDRLEALWGASERERATIAGAVYNLREERGDPSDIDVESVSRRIGLVVGDLALAAFESKLAEAWPKCLDRSQPAFRVIGGLHSVVRDCGRRYGAELTIIDVGPNLGALNRAALLGADWIITPLNGDLFSVQGLRNLGPTLRDWRDAWAERLTRAPQDMLPELPGGLLRPGGYVLSQPALRAGRVTRAFERWVARIPAEYAAVIGETIAEGLPMDEDPNCLGVLRNYRSLMPLAHDARKPVFALTAADGALGAHGSAARQAGKDFEELAKAIEARTTS